MLQFNRQQITNQFSLTGILEQIRGGILVGSRFESQIQLIKGKVSLEGINGCRLNKLKTRRMIQ